MKKKEIIKRLENVERALELRHRMGTREVLFSEPVKLNEDINLDYTAKEKDEKLEEWIRALKEIIDNIIEFIENDI